MTDKIEEEAEALIDPIAASPGFSATESRVAVFGHPIHAMSVAFPVALTLSLIHI